MGRVLVTGGAGFVGSHVVDALLARDDDVTVVDDLATGDRANVAPAATLLLADIADRDALRAAVSGRRFDAVVHCASRTKVPESMTKPELYRRVIVDGTRNVVDAASAAGARAFVNFSSGGVIYGETPTCADEERAIGPVSPYGICKAEGERLVAAASLRAVTLRPANIYGPRQRPDLEGGVVAIFLGCWRRGEPLTVYGDGTMERDYVHVADVVAAVIAAIDVSTSGVYNVGTGVATSVNALIAAMSRLLGPPPGIRSAAERPGDLRRNCVDPSKASREGLWRPRIALEEGLRLTAAS